MRRPQFLGLVTATIIFVVMALLTASTGWAAFTLQAEANPDPVEPGQMMDVQISVTTTILTGDVSLRVLWPDELGASPMTTGGGSCGGSCTAGDFLVWDLGVLGAGTTVTVGFDEIVLGGIANGTLIPLGFDLLEDAAEVENLDFSVTVEADSPLEIAVDPLPDPVASGAEQVYEIVYGNTGLDNAENTLMRFPVPAGTQFVSATGGGVFAGGTVTWDLGSLPSNSGGRVRVGVQVDALDDGTLLLVDAATLSGEVNFQARESRAMAVSRVADEAIELDVEVNPDPVEPGQMMDAQITVGNPTLSAITWFGTWALWVP